MENTRRQDKEKTFLVVLPVYNEETDLSKNFPVVHRFLDEHFDQLHWEVIIAEQASTDHTLEIAQKLSQNYPRTSCIHLDEKGRGGALREAWTGSDADVVSYMDIDFSSRLEFFPKLMYVLQGGADIAVGSRLSKGSKVHDRTLVRKFSSWAFKFFLKTLFRIRFDDAQCGFKAIRRDVFLKIAPLIKSNGWVFDTELLVIAQKARFSIAVVPIEWFDDQKSSVRIIRYALEGFTAGLRLFITRPWKSITK